MSLKKPVGTLSGPPSPELRIALDRAVEETVRQFTSCGLRSDELAITVVDLTEGTPVRHASHRGEVPLYPASVVKLFYLVAAHRWLEDGRIADTAELRRALRDMIVLSYNEATHYVVDLLTGTTSGPELAPEELRAWQEGRNAVNRYFESCGYTNINVNKKPWGEGPYGRETQSIRAFQPSRNLLTTEATARLLVDLVAGRSVSAARSAQMMELLRRDPIDPADLDPDHEARFIGPGLPSGTRLWAKAGWTSETRHDAAYVELPDGTRVVLVLFTLHHANERAILPALTRAILQGLPRLSPPPGQRERRDSPVH